jgi:hypothetical protein
VLALPARVAAMFVPGRRPAPAEAEPLRPSATADAQDDAGDERRAIAEQPRRRLGARRLLSVIGTQRMTVP